LPAKKKQHRRIIVIYLAVLAFAAMAAGLSDAVYSNYFKDAYNVSALQRGLIEFPRELPGILVVILLSLLSSFSNVRIAMLAQGLAIFGLAFLGFLTPPFAIMLVFLFINSLGGHLWYPLQDSIGLALIRDSSNAGQIIGRFKSVSTAFSLAAALLVFTGFRLGWFSFTSPVKWVFVIAMAFLLITMLLLGHLDHQVKTPETVATGKRFRFVFRKEYKFYYLLAIVFGVQKQIMFVYAPWVLIDLLEQKTDTMAVLGMISALIGIFFIPALGRWIDRFGIKKMLYYDAFSFILVYLAYGTLSAGFSSGGLVKVGVPVLLAFVLFIVDRMSMQMSIIRTLYLRLIAVEPADIAPTLTMAQSMDHIVAVLCATVGGVIWTVWGPQYIFFMAAFLSLINFFVAIKVRVPDRAIQ
jgi:predicted MFS family arabinose efflux permease